MTEEMTFFELILPWLLIAVGCVIRYTAKEPWKGRFLSLWWFLVTGTLLFAWVLQSWYGHGYYGPTGYLMFFALVFILTGVIGLPWVIYLQLRALMPLIQLPEGPLEPEGPEEPLGGAAPYPGDKVPAWKRMQTEG